MAVRSRFAPRVPQAPSGRKLSVQVIKDMRGLNSTDPYGILQPSASPYLRNARMYASDTERQVSISTRQGAVEYTVPVGETADDSETSTDNASTTTVSVIRQIAQPFIPTATKPLTKLDVKVEKLDGTAPLLVRIFTDDSGSPDELIATTTIPNQDIPNVADYVTCRFVEAPTVTISTDYWIVLSIQEDQDTEYTLTTTDNTTDGLESVDGGNTWSALNESINFRIYLSDAGGVKGARRFYPQNNQFSTMFAHDQDIYVVDDTDGSTSSLKSGLNANATRYRFAQFDDAMFVVNGLDTMQRSTGGAFADVTASPSVASIVVAHKNRLFTVSAGDKNRIEFSEAADYETWESTNFIYVPTPKSSDPITALYSFQDTLVVLTANDKYVIYGDDLATFQVKQSLGQKGAVSQEAVTADENYLYFVNSDGHVYRWNGSRDEQISRTIESDLDDVASVNSVQLNYCKDKLYYWFQQTGQTNFTSCFVYETRYQEWFYDTGRYAKGIIVLDQENDDKVLLSDRAGVLYKASTNYSDLGRPIDFRYYTNYHDFQYPDNFKQVRRLYLHFRKTDWSGRVVVGCDVDFRDDPVTETINLQSGGAIWGEFVWGDFVWGSNDQYERYRMTVPGQGTHYQVRVEKNGAETPLYFIGYSNHYRLRRAA
jgi:hypothetical protein